MKLYKAICQSMDGAYFETSHYYASEREARAWNDDCYVGLFTDGPCIDIPQYVEIYPHSPKREKTVIEPISSQDTARRELEKIRAALEQPKFL